MAVSNRLLPAAYPFIFHYTHRYFSVYKKARSEIIGTGQDAGLLAVTLRGWEAGSVALLAAQGSLGAAAREAGQLQRRIVSQTVAAQHVLDIASAEAEVVQQTFVEIGKAVRSKTIAKRNAKGSEPHVQTGEARGKRPARRFSDEFEVKIEDPIVRAHSVILSAGTRRLPRPRKRTGDEVWGWKLGRKPVGEDYNREDAESILISPTNVSNGNHQHF
jgi:hypothetical protein